MNATLEAINPMQADGVLGQYAIAGAVGATPYLEPAATPGCGHFCDTAFGSGELVAQSCAARTVPDGPIVVRGWPLQFLPEAMT